MFELPIELKQSKKITTFIRDVLSYTKAKNFNDLDELDQDKFTTLCIQVLGCDLEIILSEKAIISLTNYLDKYDLDEAIELIKNVKESAKEKVSRFFDELLNEEKSSRRMEINYERGITRQVNRTNGEVTYI